MKKETKDQIKKNKNNGAGVPIESAIMGKGIITIAAASQFENVENGIIFGSTISAIYTQTIGPIENPRLNIYMIRPVKIKPFPALSAFSLIKNPIAINSKQNEAHPTPI